MYITKEANATMFDTVDGLRYVADRMHDCEDEPNCLRCFGCQFETLAQLSEIIALTESRLERQTVRQLQKLVAKLATQLQGW
jgi:hypothetical protein